MKRLKNDVLVTPEMPINILFYVYELCTLFLLPMIVFLYYCDIQEETAQECVFYGNSTQIIFVIVV